MSPTDYPCCPNCGHEHFGLVDYGEWPYTPDGHPAESMTVTCDDCGVKFEAERKTKVVYECRPFGTAAGRLCTRCGADSKRSFLGPFGCALCGSRV